MSDCYGWRVIVTTYVAATFTFASFGVRVYMKRWVIRLIWWDDGPFYHYPSEHSAWLTISLIVLCFAALVVGVVRDIGNTLGMSCVPSGPIQLVDVWLRTAVYPVPGVGCHIDTVPPERLKDLYAVFQLETISYLLSIPLAKLSVLVLCYRLFRSNPWFRRTCYVLFVIIASYGLTSFLTALFRCSPVGAAWTSPIKGNSRCLSIVRLQIAVGWINIVTDVALMILPMPVLWSLKMPWQKKAGVFVVFATGGAVVAMSVARQSVLYKSLNGLDKDITWSAMLTHILFTLELNIAIICGCLPTMQPLFRRFAATSAFRSVFSSGRRSGGSRTRTGTFSNVQGSTGPPPPTWGSVPIRKKVPSATPTVEPAWTKEWHWGIMHDEDDTPDESGQGSCGSGHKRTPRSPWFPRTPRTPKSPVSQENAENLAKGIVSSQGDGEQQAVQQRALTPIYGPQSIPSTNSKAKRVPSPLATPSRIITQNGESTDMTTNTSKSNTRSSISAMPRPALIIRGGHSTSSALQAPSPTSIRFAPQVSQTERLLMSSSKLQERRGRQSLNLGALPSFRPPPLSRSTSDPYRRRSENDSSSTPLSPRWLTRVRETKDEA